MKRTITALVICLSITSLFADAVYAKRLVMITGAGRGLGLLLSEQFLKAGDTLIATHRDKTIPDSLIKLKKQYADKLTLEPLELTDLIAVKKLGEKYRNSEHKIDILINNAGIYSPREPTENTFQTLYQNIPQLKTSMEVNAESPMVLASTLLTNIAQSNTKMILLIGSAGSRFSVDDKKRDRQGFTYVMSKSALHKAIDQAASDLKNPAKCQDKKTCAQEQQVTMVGIDPGWIDTDMGKGSKHSQPQAGSAEKAADSIYKLVTSGAISNDLSGQLIDINGKRFNW